MPYYDNDGFAGVVGIACSSAEIYRQVADGVIGETGFNFVMNAEGKVILSTDMGYVSSEFGGNDLRQSYDSDIAEAARRMVAGEKDVRLVILHNFALSMKTPDDFAAVMTLANRQLCHDNEEMLFVTVLWECLT